MSRVSDALRHADRTGAIPAPPPPPSWAPRRAASVRFNRSGSAPIPITSAREEPREEPVVMEEETPARVGTATLTQTGPVPGFWLTVRRLVSARVGSGTMGQALIKIGVLPRTTYQVARCSAVTRNGVACRAPAMANGRCRMHGGSKQRAIWEIGRKQA